MTRVVRGLVRQSASMFLDVVYRAAASPSRTACRITASGMHWWRLRRCTMSLSVFRNVAVESKNNSIVSAAAWLPGRGGPTGPRGPRRSSHHLMSSRQCSVHSRNGTVKLRITSGAVDAPAGVRTPGHQCVTHLLCISVECAPSFVVPPRRIGVCLDQHPIIGSRIYNGSVVGGNPRRSPL